MRLVKKKNRQSEETSPIEKGAVLFCREDDANIGYVLTDEDVRIRIDFRFDKEYVLKMLEFNGKNELRIEIWGDIHNGRICSAKLFPKAMEKFEKFIKIGI